MNRSTIKKSCVVCLVLLIASIILGLLIFLQKEEEITRTSYEEPKVVTAIIKMDTIEKREEETESETENDDILLLAQLIQAEAGNQPLTGMRFVADVVLNRVDDDRFPDTIANVIYEENQFSVINDGSFDLAINYISEDAIKAAELEMEERLDYDILYFSSTSEPINGVRPFRYYGHWFSYQE